MKKGDVVTDGNGAKGIVRDLQPRYVACGPHGYIIREDVYVDWYVGEPLPEPPKESSK